MFGVLAEAHGRMTGEINHRIHRLQKIMVSFQLCISVFRGCDLCIETKRLVYQTVVLGILCTVQRSGLQLRYLETFHHCCTRCIMGIGHAVQWTEHNTTAQLAECFGMRESISILLS